jgi:biopolymer transport protein ExbD
MAGNINNQSKNRGRGNAIISEINVVPLVDIVLVLLIIMMVTSIAIVRGSVEVNLPEIATADNAAKSLLSVTIYSDGSVLLNGSKVSEDGLKDGIREILKNKPDTQAIISADVNVIYGRVMEIIDLARSLGVKKFAANVERKK